MPGVNAVVMPGVNFYWSCSSSFYENGDLKDQGQLISRILLFRFVRFATIANQLNEPEDVRFEPGTHQVTTVGHNGDSMSVTLSEERTKPSILIHLVKQEELLMWLHPHSK